MPPRRTATETKFLKEQLSATRWKINYLESNAPQQHVAGKPGQFEMASDYKAQLDTLLRDEKLLGEMLAPKKRDGAAPKKKRVRS